MVASSSGTTVVRNMAAVYQVFRRNPSPEGAITYLADSVSERSPLLDRRGGAKRRGGCSIKVPIVLDSLLIFRRILNNHPVCGFAAATPPSQEGRWLA